MYLIRFPGGVLLLALLLSCGSGKSPAPENPALGNLSSTRSFSRSGVLHSPADFLALELTTRFLPGEKSAPTAARLRFRAAQSGYAYFLLDPEPGPALLNGEPVSLVSIRDPDNENLLRVMERPLEEGKEYELSLEYSIPAAEVTYDSNGVRFFTSMSDIGSGNYLEDYAPANFETDSFSLRWNLSVEGAATSHRLFSNGESRQTGPHAWTVEFPDYFVSSSFFLHLSHAPFTVKEGVYQGLLGPIPYMVYSQDSSLVDSAMSALPGLFQELESTYGPYAHRSFLAYMAGKGGMEYCGATITSLGALAHELTHSWFARGAMPSDGRSGWIDEAVASWRDHRYFRAATLGSRPPTNLGRFSAFRRFTPGNSYVDGRNFLAELDLQLAAQGGLRPVLKEFFQRWSRKNFRTGDFQALVEEKLGTRLGAQFQRYVYGGDGNFEDNPAIQEASPFHRPLSREELLRLR